jgi:phenylacetate-CoA ligase
MLELCGYRPGVRRAMVWGVHDDLPPQSLRGTFKQWFRRYASSQETLCCVVMNERLMMDYHQRLLRFRPEVLYGYPSALTQLGRFIEDRRLEPIRVKAVITTAERLSGANRRQLIRMYGGEVFNLYCTREHGCIGFECERHQGLHIDTGSVFLETIKDGRPVEPGQPGEIVITDLLNYGMPFIRSRMGDVGVRSPQPCECGSPLPVLKRLDGRSSDLLYRPDGSVVPGLMLTDLFKDLPSIRFLQFVQESVKQLDVLLVVTDAFSEQVRTEVVREVRELMGDDIAVRVKLVDEIERNPRSGKLQEFICKVKKPQGENSTQRHI